MLDGSESGSIELIDSVVTGDRAISLLEHQEDTLDGELTPSWHDSTPPLVRVADAAIALLDSHPVTASAYPSSLRMRHSDVDGENVPCMECGVSPKRTFMGVRTEDISFTLEPINTGTEDRTVVAGTRQGCVDRGSLCS